MKNFIASFTRYTLCIGMLTVLQLHTQPTTIIYCHGIVDNASQAQRFATAFPSDSNLIAVNFADSIPATGYNLNALIGYVASLAGKTVNRNKMFMGQADDLNVIGKALKSCRPTTPVIAYGCSRGAAAWLTYIGKYNPENIKALILDACPADMVQGLDPQLAKLGIPLTMDTSIFQTLFPAYPHNAISPLQAIKTIKNKNLPILLIHSKTDRRVAWINSLMLYQAFKDNGFTNVHLCIVPDGNHSFILQNSDQAAHYLQAVHSFYNRYNIAHNPEHLANQPFTVIPDAQIKQIIQRYQLDLKNLQTTTAGTLWYYTKLAGATALTLAIIKAYLSKN